MRETTVDGEPARLVDDQYVGCLNKNWERRRVEQALRYTNSSVLLPMSRRYCMPRKSIALHPR